MRVPSIRRESHVRLVALAALALVALASAGSVGVGRELRANFDARLLEDAQDFAPFIHRPATAAPPALAMPRPVRDGLAATVRPAPAEAVEGATFSTRGKGDERERVVHLVTGPAPAVLLEVRAELHELERQLAWLAWAMLGVVGGSLGLLAVTAAAFARRQARTLREIDEAVRAVRAGRRPELPERGRHDEIDALCDHLEDAYERFSSAVSKRA